jgi:hypothetical protein
MIVLIEFCNLKKIWGKKNCLIHMFASCITSHTRIFSDTLHYLSFKNFTYLIYLKKLEEDKMQI